MPTKEELIELMRNDKVEVLVVSKGKLPDKYPIPGVNIKCALCDGDAHMSAANIEITKDYLKVHYECLIETGLISSSTEHLALVQGHKMGVRDGLSLVKEMVKPRPPKESN